jgi:hypothetical protein
MDILLFNDVSLVNENKTIIYGQYKRKFTSIEIKPKIHFSVIFCNNRNDFYIEIHEKISYIDEITFIYAKDIEIIKNDIVLLFPFENCNLSLNSNSSIISTFCKDYSHRLDEWIQYNLNLGFSGIVIFDNDENKNNKINENKNNKINEDLNNIQNKVTVSDICEKYKSKVHCVKFSYSPMKGNHYDTIQRISLHIGVNAFRNKCSKIALIDADEFIHVPKHSSIIEFLSHYKGKTLTMQSNILTNKLDDDIINNNILDLCLYVGENKYTKTIIDTNSIKPMEFIVTPHSHPTQILLNKDEIIHYHCWVNSRYKYDQNMLKIEFLKTIYSS